MCYNQLSKSHIALIWNFCIIQLAQFQKLEQIFRYFILEDLFLQEVKMHPPPSHKQYQINRRKLL